MRRIDLNGRWQIRDSKGEFSLVGLVPGVVQADLVREGLLPHPMWEPTKIFLKKSKIESGSTRESSTFGKIS
ncbi:hypothetical protein [Thermotoga neapolitana]|uniref:hypothetical protein n=1 Tax=Thermotoga neapolitana TaxID=2337 RepID=UPI001E39C52A|nr:hypothetical protein [Thermotoga neapolitana]